MAALPRSHIIPDSAHLKILFFLADGGEVPGALPKTRALPASPHFTGNSLVYPPLPVVCLGPMDTAYWVLTAIILPFCCGGVGGLCLAVVHKWGQTRHIVELEYRLDDLEGRVTREVKIRAGAKGTEARNKADDLVEWAKNNTPEPALGKQNFVDWRKSKMVSPPGG